MKLYVGGPMRGYDQFNFPAFDAAAAFLRQCGHEVISPAEMDRERGLDETQNTTEGFDVQDALRRDFLAILQDDTDGIALLPGWSHSEGAKAERFVAEMAGKKVFYVNAERGAAWLRDEVGRCVTYASCPAPGCKTTGLVSKWRPWAGVDRDPPWLTAELIEPVSSPDFGEVRVTDPNTGGAKGQKLAQLGAIDPLALMELAKVAGFGGAKYDRFNYVKGYAWSLSVDALFRHLLAFLDGQEVDEESGLPHMAHACWHTLALLTFSLRDLGTDDRIKPAA